MHINIHDVHVEALNFLNFVTSWYIDAISRWIKQRKICAAALMMRHHGMPSQLCCGLRGAAAKF